MDARMEGRRDVEIDGWGCRDVGIKGRGNGGLQRWRNRGVEGRWDVEIERCRDREEWWNGGTQG